MINARYGATRSATDIITSRLPTFPAQKSNGDQSQSAGRTLRLTSFLGFDQTTTTTFPGTRSILSNYSTCYANMFYGHWSLDNCHYPRRALTSEATPLPNYGYSPSTCSSGQPAQNRVECGSKHNIGRSVAPS